MDQRARDVLKIGDELFGQKASFDSLCQELALNFYTARADFTTKRNDGDEYNDHNFSSAPELARRELGNLMSASLRPRSQDWFSIHVEDEDLDNGVAEREYLEHLTKIQRRAMYDAQSFVEATKQADHDFATFGNAVLKYGPNLAADGLLFRNYHLRDNAWTENAEGKIDANHRNWEPTARQLKEHFPKTVSKQVLEACKKTPEKTFKCRHVVLPSRLYDYKSPAGKRFPFVSLYVERESETVLEEVGLNYFCYVIPRWQRVSGSVFGRSMATDILLPDGRTIQVVVRTLREAAEKHVDPPQIAFGDAIRGDIAMQAGGITIADIEYVEHSEEILRPLARDKSGFPIGMEVAEALKMDIRAGFFLDKIQLPEIKGDATAYQVRKIIEDAIRSQAPIFEPIEEQYNQPLCSGVFDVMRDHGAFPMQDMPESLAGSDIRFSFRSPLADMAEQREAEIYVDGMTRVLAPILTVDPSQIENVDVTEATRDALRAVGFKAKWFKPKEAVAARQQQMAKAAQMAQGAEALGTLGQIVEQGGKAAQAVNEADGKPA